MSGPWMKYRQGGTQAVPSDPLKVQGATTDISQGQARTDQIRQDIRKNPISDKDASTIAAMRDQVGNMGETLQMFDNAAKVVDRFRTAPGKAANVRSAVPAPDAGFMGGLRARFMQNLLGVPDQDVRDFQELERLTNLGVAQRQLAQKGPQTESDALRYRLAGLSPDKDVNVNALTIGEGIFHGMMTQQRPGFYTRWANKYGSLAATNNGQTVDDAWAAEVERRRAKFNADPRIAKLRNGGSSAPSSVIRYDRNGNRIQ